VGRIGSLQIRLATKVKYWLYVYGYLTREKRDKVHGGLQLMLSSPSCIRCENQDESKQTKIRKFLYLLSLVPTSGTVQKQLCPRPPHVNKALVHIHCENPFDFFSPLSMECKTCKLVITICHLRIVYVS